MNLDYCLTNLFGPTNASISYLVYEKTLDIDRIPYVVLFHTKFSGLPFPKNTAVLEDLKYAIKFDQLCGVIKLFIKTYCIFRLCCHKFDF